MRVLVISDLHGNDAALRAVLDAAGSVDSILCLGDLVDYGPEPAACVDWVRRHATAVVRGNHDDALVRGIRCECSPESRGLSDATQNVARRQVTGESLEWLASLPAERRVELGGVRFHLVHATPRDPLFEYLGPERASDWERAVEAADADVVLVGHTHLPMILEAGGHLVVNPGSVGQPRDGDARAAFAVFDEGVPRLARAAYDVERVVRRLGSRGIEAGTRRSLATILRSGGQRGPTSTAEGK